MIRKICMICMIFFSSTMYFSLFARGVFKSKTCLVENDSKVHHYLVVRTVPPLPSPLLLAASPLLRQLLRNQNALAYNRNLEKKRKSNNY